MSEVEWHSNEDKHFSLKLTEDSDDPEERVYHFEYVDEQSMCSFLVSGNQLEDLTAFWNRERERVGQRLPEESEEE